MYSPKEESPAKPSNWKRRCFHLWGTLAILMAALLLPEGVFIIGLCTITMGFILLEILRFYLPGLNQWFVGHFFILLREEEVMRPVTSTYILVASVIIFLLFGRDIAVASLFFLAVGDPVASAVGQRWGRVRIRYKTLEGSLAFFLFSCAGGAILGSTVLSLGLSAIIAGALLAALAELLSFHLDDNLTIPLASSGGMYVVKSVFIG